MESTEPIRVDRAYPSRPSLSESTGPIRVDRAYPSRPILSESTDPIRVDRAYPSRPGLSRSTSAWASPPPLALRGLPPIPTARLSESPSESLSESQEATLHRVCGAGPGCCARLACRAPPPSEEPGGNRATREGEGAGRGCVCVWGGGGASPPRAGVGRPLVDHPSSFLTSHPAF